MSDIARHYNNRKSQSFDERNKSPILHLRNFNNWIKSVLLNKYLKVGFTVLDICAGKGGDLKKYAKGKIDHLVHADIADKSVETAVERYNLLNGGKPRFSANFIVADCCRDGLQKTLSSLNIKFDVVSCQFALHYAFESEERCRTILKNISEFLKPGGYFLGTTPNANWIVKKLRAVEGMSFGNDIYKITFPKEYESKHEDVFTPFGCKYQFYLHGAVDAAEYLVHFPTLKRIANEYDLELAAKQTFHGFYNNHCNNREYKTLMRKMRVTNSAGTIPKNNWDAAGFYLVYVFFKRGASQVTQGRRYQPDRYFERVSKSEIIYSD